MLRSTSLLLGLVWLALLSAALGPRMAAAYEIGNRVAVMQDDTQVLAGSLAIDRLEAGEVLDVLNVKDGWLLVSRGRPGWIDAKGTLGLEEAAGALNAIAAQRPTDAHARVARARFWLATDHPDESIAEAGEAIRLSPNLIAGWIIRSAAHRVKKDYASALVDAQSAVQLNAKSHEAHLAAGDVWRDQRQTEHAAQEYALAVELDKKNCEAYLRLGQARLASLSPTQWPEAAEDFSKTIRLAENAPACRRAARLGRGTAWDKEGRYTAALEEFNELLAENKKDIEALAGRGSVYANLFRYEKAIPDLDYAIELDPQNAHWWVARATIRMKQYNFRGAIKDLDEAVKRDPNRSEAYLVRGQVLSRQKKWAAAIAALTQAINLDSGNASAYLARADVYQAKGDADLAKADRAQVGRLNPQLLAPPSGKELMEQERRKATQKFANTAGQSG